MNVKCPGCGAPTQFTPENPHRPFCSERCRLIDLGQWAEGKYSIPVVDLSDIDESDLPVDSDDESGGSGASSGVSSGVSSEDLH